MQCNSISRRTCVRTCAGSHSLTHCAFVRSFVRSFVCSFVVSSFRSLSRLWFVCSRSQLTVVVCRTVNVNAKANHRGTVNGRPAGRLRRQHPSIQTSTPTNTDTTCCYCCSCCLLRGQARERVRHHPASYWVVGVVLRRRCGDANVGHAVNAWVPQWCRRRSVTQRVISAIQHAERKGGCCRPRGVCAGRRGMRRRRNRKGTNKKCPTQLSRFVYFHIPLFTTQVPSPRFRRQKCPQLCPPRVNLVAETTSLSSPL